MKKGYDEQEINWKSRSIYIDIDTGEIISKEKAIKEYVIIKTKTFSNVYKKNGTREHTHECRRSKQLRLEL